jgi:hypothetical protein
MIKNVGCGMKHMPIDVRPEAGPFLNDGSWDFDSSPYRIVGVCKEDDDGRIKVKGPKWRELPLTASGWVGNHSCLYLYALVARGKYIPALFGVRCQHSADGFDDQILGIVASRSVLCADDATAS